MRNHSAALGCREVLCYQGHALMENRNGLVVSAVVTHADGFGERRAAVAMLDALPGSEVVGCGSSLKFCRIADGGIDLYPRFGPTSEWDTAAAQAVVEAAGGAVVKTNGEQLRYNTKADLLNPHFLVYGDRGRDWLQILSLR